MADIAHIGAALLLIAAVILAAPATRAADMAGKVTDVSGGGLITVLVEGRQVKIKLAEIDMPERGQPWAKEARQALSDLLLGKDVRIVEQPLERARFPVARVYAGTIDVSAELISEGHAWVFRKFATDDRLYWLEEQAKASRRGLWALPEAQRTEPWNWRRGGATPEATLAPASTPANCGAKRDCRQMASCEEAKFYFSECGLQRLDNDGDGVPCNRLCP